MLDNAVYEPLKSIANFAFTAHAPPKVSGQYEASFYFLWPNNYGQEVLINAETSVTAKGSCFIHTAFLRNNLFAFAMGQVGSAVGLDIFELWNHPETSPLQEQGQLIIGFANMDVDGRRYFGIPTGNEEAHVDVFQTLKPTRSGFFFVPRNGSVLFQVFVFFTVDLSTFDMFHDDPLIATTVNFSLDDGFFVQCPFVHLEVIVPPIAT